MRVWRIFPARKIKKKACIKYIKFFLQWNRCEIYFYATALTRK